MSNKTKLVQRQPLTATVRPFQLLRGFSRPMMGTEEDKSHLSKKWPPLGGSGDACLLGLRAASGLGLGRRWQAGRQEGRLGKEEGGKKKRERHGTPGGSRLPTNASSSAIGAQLCKSGFLNYQLPISPAQGIGRRRRRRRRRRKGYGDNGVFL